MKKIAWALFLLFILGTSFKSNVCSPVLTPFKEWLSNYNEREYSIVEGYFLATKGSQKTSEFKVVKTSNTEIKIGAIYRVFEYGPFGDNCELFELGASIDTAMAGPHRPRLLFLYKKRSVQGKLVTPIFWDAGIQALHNKLVTKEYNHKSQKYDYYECTSHLEDIWKQILTTGSLHLLWKEKTAIEKTKN
ncbi:MAG: hypothetical protein R2781_09410 [Flavobacteriaceae bacterium]